MMNQTLLGFGNVFFNSLREKFVYIEELVDNSLSQSEKKYSPYFIKYLIRTGNIHILEYANKISFISNIKENIQKDIIHFLRNYKRFDIRILIVNLENKYGLNEEEIKDYIKELEIKNKLRVGGNIIYPNLQ